MYTYVYSVPLVAHSAVADLHMLVCVCMCMCVFVRAGVQERAGGGTQKRASSVRGKAKPANEA